MSQILDTNEENVSSDGVSSESQKEFKKLNESTFVRTRVKSTDVNPLHEDQQSSQMQEQDEQQSSGES